jgi:2-alkenal reductase
MDNKLKFLGVGCLGAVLATALLGLVVVFGLPLIGGWLAENVEGAPATQFVINQSEDATPINTPTQIKTDVATAAVGTPVVENPSVASGMEHISSEYLNQLYETTSPGVVSIYVLGEEAMPSDQGAGSGFIYDDSGHIVTNNHVVENAGFVMVVFHDGKREEAEVVGLDPDSDLAVIRVEQLPDNVTPLPVGNMDQVDPGDWVIAIGNPFGLNSSMTIGIVSAVGRTIPSGTTPFAIPRAIQTDAAINPGNSGGPLLNLEGQVIGVNAQIASGTGSNAGVGFSIPADIIRRVIPALIEVGEFQWSWLGVRGTSVNFFIREANDLSVEQGAYLLEVVPGSPAAIGGLEGGTELETVEGLEVPTGGDVIIEADDTPIESYSDLQIYIAEQEPGTTVTFSVLREGEIEEISVELAPRPEQ